METRHGHLRWDDPGIFGKAASAQAFPEPPSKTMINPDGRDLEATIAQQQQQIETLTAS